ncbi:uncharacterized protein LOC144108072 [Amblyomma americanum]
MVLKASILEYSFMRCLVILMVILLSRTTGNSGSQEDQHKAVSSASLLRLDVLEGEQTSLPCPADVASRRAVSAIWYHFATTDPSRHEDHSPHISSVHSQAKKVYSLVAPAMPSTPVLAGSAGLVDGTHWKQPSWSGRAFFSLLSDPPALLLNRLERSDTGSYVCNVTYRDDGDNGTYPLTVTEAHVELFVSVPLPPPLIMDHTGALLNRTAGPYAENDTLRLKCVAPSAKRKLNLEWRRNGKQLSPHLATLVTSGGGLESTLEIGPLLREHLFSNFSCVVSSDSSRPVESSVVLDMFLAPKDVALRNWPHGRNDASGWVMMAASKQPDTSAAKASTLVAVQAVEAPGSAASHNTPTASWTAGTDSKENWDTGFPAPRSFECVVTGSRPYANVTWFLDGWPLDGRLSHIRTEGDVTASVLLLPALEHAGKLLECRATNSHLPEERGVVRRYLAVNISNKPEVNIKLGSGLNASHIVEGADVYMECSVLTTSTVTDVTWSQDGRELGEEPAEDMVLTSRYLVIRSVEPRHSGSYTCTVTSSDSENVESKPLHLHVQYSPRCDGLEEHTISAEKGTPVNVTCNVRAEPIETLRFFWLLENHTETAKIPREKRQPSRMREVHRPLVTESNRLEIIVNDTFLNATLGCWAENAVGMQRKRCRFKFAYKGDGFSGLACSVSNCTDTSFSLTCWTPPVNNITMATSRKRQQRLRVEVFDSSRSNRSEHSFWSRDMGPVLISRLRPSTDYLVVVRMPPTATFRTYVRTLSPTQTLMGQGDFKKTTQQERWTLTLSVVVVLTCCLAAALVALASTYYACANRRRRRKVRWEPDKGDGASASYTDKKSDHVHVHKLNFASIEIS